MSKHIPRAFIDDLLARSDIVDLINGYVSLRKTGKNFSACCPFHEEKTPSFSVSPDKQFYYCFGCGAKGNAISFLMDYAQLEFVEAVQELSHRQGLDIPYEQQGDDTERVDTSRRQAILDVLGQAAQFYQQQLRQHPEKQQAIAYLKQRGLSGDIAADFGLGFAPSGWDHLLQQFGQTAAQQQILLEAGLLIEKEQGGFYDRFRHRIMFPIQDRRGQVVAFGGRVLDDSKPKYLNSPETPVFHKGQELYGLYATRQQRPAPDTLLVVEGYMDVVALAQFDVRNAVATLGTATSTEHLKRLFRVVDQVVFCFDGDEAGRKAAWRALDISMPLLGEGREARFMFLPDGEDPDTLVRQEGAKAFQQRIQQAQPLAAFLFQYLAEHVDSDSLTGQMQLLEQAKPVLDKMPEGPAKQLLRDRLGAIDMKNLTQLVPNDSDQTAQQSQHLWQARVQGEREQKQAFRGHLSSMSPMRTVIGLLIQHPILIEHLPELAQATLHDIAGGQILGPLVDFIRQHPHCNTGMILEHWRDDQYSGALHKLAAWEHHLPDDGLVAEFCDAMRRVNQDIQEQRLEMLLQKSRLDHLSRQEKEEFTTLMQQRVRH